MLLPHNHPLFNAPLMSLYQIQHQKKMAMVMTSYRYTQLLWPHRHSKIFVLPKSSFCIQMNAKRGKNGAEWKMLLDLQRPSSDGANSCRCCVMACVFMNNNPFRQKPSMTAPYCWF